MSKGKYSKNQSFNVRPLVLMLAVALLIGATIGGTIAWLTAKTEDVVNTFTVGDVALTLKESQLILKDNGDINYNDKGEMQYKDPAEGVTSVYPMIPGTTYKKDPIVEVSAESEDCYLFVKVVEKNNPSKYLNYTYTMTKENGWIEYTKGNTVAYPTGDKTTVWYREVKKTDTNKTFNLLEKNQIAINSNVVKANTNPVPTGMVPMPAADKAPNLIFTAYAVQTANLTVDQAWAEVSK